jgi:hypothetical protein
MIDPGRTRRIVRLAAAFILVIVGYGLLHDLQDGFAWSRSSASWKLWLAGLFVGGLLSIVLESAFEWVFEPDHWYSTGPRRRMRVAIAVGVIVFIVGVVAVVRLLLQRI